MSKKHAGLDSEHEPNIGISVQDRNISIGLLNNILSDMFVLYLQTLNYHWNIVGPQFNDYHKLFDGQYNELFEEIDMVAERVRAVGGIAYGTMQEMISNASLQEDGGDIPEPRQMVKNLLSQHEKLIRNLRVAVDQTAENMRDMGTSDFLNGIMITHEKTAWMLRALAER
jgi:starvation-inducible DNA-binding protein